MITTQPMSGRKVISDRTGKPATLVTAIILQSGSA
jgi:hypothetical protein